MDALQLLQRLNEAEDFDDIAQRYEKAAQRQSELPPETWDIEEDPGDPDAPSKDAIRRAMPWGVLAVEEVRLRDSEEPYFHPYRHGMRVDLRSMGDNVEFFYGRFSSTFHIGAVRLDRYSAGVSYWFYRNYDAVEADVVRTWESRFSDDPETHEKFLRRFIDYNRLAVGMGKPWLDDVINKVESWDFETKVNTLIDDGFLNRSEVTEDADDSVILPERLIRDKVAKAVALYIDREFEKTTMEDWMNAQYSEDEISHLARTHRAYDFSKAAKAALREEPNFDNVLNGKLARLRHGAYVLQLHYI